VDRRPTAAQVVVVHAGEIVVDEGVGVDQLDGDGQRQRCACLSADGLGGGEGEDRTQSLAAREQQMAHRAVQIRRHAVGRPIEARFDRGIDQRDPLGHVGFDVHDAPTPLTLRRRDPRPFDRRPIIRLEVRFEGLDPIPRALPDALRHEDLDPALGRVERRCTAPRERDPFLEGFERLLEGQIAGLETRDDPPRAKPGAASKDTPAGAACASPPTPALPSLRLDLAMSRRL
jgi:hypothetical protein